MAVPTFEDTMILMGVKHEKLVLLKEITEQLIATRLPSKAVLDAYKISETLPHNEAFALAFLLAVLMAKVTYEQK